MTVSRKVVLTLTMILLVRNIGQGETQHRKYKGIKDKLSRMFYIMDTSLGNT